MKKKPTEEVEDELRQMLDRCASAYEFTDYFVKHHKRIDWPVLLRRLADNIEAEEKEERVNAMNLKALITLAVNEAWRKS